MSREGSKCCSGLVQVCPSWSDLLICVVLTAKQEVLNRHPAQCCLMLCSDLSGHPQHGDDDNGCHDGEANGRAGSGVSGGGQRPVVRHEHLQLQLLVPGGGPGHRDHRELPGVWRQHRWGNLHRAGQGKPHRTFWSFAQVRAEAALLHGVFRCSRWSRWRWSRVWAIGRSRCCWLRRPLMELPRTGRLCCSCRPTWHWRWGGQLRNFYFENLHTDSVRTEMRTKTHSLFGHHVWKMKWDWINFSNIDFLKIIFTKIHVSKFDSKCWTSEFLLKH